MRFKYDSSMMMTLIMCTSNEQRATSNTLKYAIIFVLFHLFIIRKFVGQGNESSVEVNSSVEEIACEQCGFEM